MNWLQKIAQDELEYFSIGHGDYDEEVGFEPKYIVWAYLYGRIKHGPESYGEGVIQESDEELPSSTHGTLWGHGVTDKTYKGRYEPETGRLSIVKPSGTEQEPVPGRVMRALYQTFSRITEVFEF